MMKVYPDNSTVYKYFRTPVSGKVICYYIIDGKEVGAGEWNKDINSESELMEFAKENEAMLDII
jgi:hypothetical protein